MELIVRNADGAPGSLRPVEVVERKGRGHPDSLCDGIAEHICVTLCRHYRERFGVILHHNVDKVLLVGGAARPEFGGGEFVEPIEIYLAGRATRSFRGEEIPVDALATAACLEWLARYVPALDLERGVRVFPRLRSGSVDLKGLFEREGPPRANDTSYGVGFAPLSPLEQAVLAVDEALQSPATRANHPSVGTDTKVMGVRRGGNVHLTVSCAFIGRHLIDLSHYAREKEAVRALAISVARASSGLQVELEINVADDLERGEIFLTVTGTSAEAGDDGEVGRGNRVTGLITPYRAMTLEAGAGKNPVTHVGKLYSLAASQIAASMVSVLPGVDHAACLLVSQIGREVSDPQLVDVALWPTAQGAPRAAVEAVIRAGLADLGAIREALLAERLAVF